MSRTPPRAYRPFQIAALEPRQFLSVALPNVGATAMAYDTTGALHVAYYDTADHHLKYARQGADGTWSAVDTLDADGDVGSQLSMALDSAGRPVVAYYDATNADLKLVRRAKKTWAVTRIDQRGDVGQHPSLALAAGDAPVVSYFAATTEDLRLASLVRGRWRITTLDARGSTGRFSSVAIDPAGQWAVAFEDHRDYDIKLIRPAGGGLRTEFVAHPAYTGAFFETGVAPNLAFDPAGNPAVAFADGYWNAPVFYRPGRRGWGRFAISGAFQAIGRDTKFWFDAQSGLPQILYTDADGTTTLATYNRKGVGSTRPIGTAGSAAGAAYDPVGRTFAVIDSATGEVAPFGADLAAPTGVTATLASLTEVDVNWADPSGGGASFVIQRSDQDGVFETIGAVDPGHTSYADTTCLEGVFHAYRVMAVYGDVRSPAAASADLLVPPTPPTDVRAEDTGAGVHLTWTEQSARAPFYIVQRSADGGGTWSWVASLGFEGYPAPEEFTDATAPELTALRYRVIASMAQFTPRGVPSAEVLIMPNVHSPTDLSATIVSPPVVGLHWTDHSGIETGYEIWVADDGMTWQGPVATLPADTESYDLTGLLAGQTYGIRVKAVDGHGHASAVEQVEVMLPDAP